MRILCILLLFSSLYAIDLVNSKLDSAEFHENTSTVFGLIGASPSSINTFGSMKEVKIDWFYKEGFWRPGY